MMTREEIKKIIPQREPMLLVDEAELLEDGTAVGRYTVRGDEFFLQGHFPGHPVVPGVILCEMAGQCCCAMMAGEEEGKTGLFAGMNNVRFRRQVRPGDTVEFRGTVVRSYGPVRVIKSVGTVNGQTVFTGELQVVLTDLTADE